MPEVFVSGREIWPADASAARPPSSTPRILESCWRPQGRNAGRLVLKLNGSDSISDAETLAGSGLFLREADLPALDPDTFLVRDLVGCTLWDNDRIVGTVTGLELPVGPDGRTRLIDAADLLVVAPSPPLPETSDTSPENLQAVLVPFVRAWLVDVDIRARRMVMRLPPGLFDDDAPPIVETTPG